MSFFKKIEFPSSKSKTIFKSNHCTCNFLDDISEVSFCAGFDRRYERMINLLPFRFTDGFQERGNFCTEDVSRTDGIFVINYTLNGFGEYYCSLFSNFKEGRETLFSQMSPDEFYKILSPESDYQPNEKEIPALRKREFPND